MVSLVLIACAGGWASHASLHREVWVGFGGQELTFRDRLTFRADQPQVLYLVEPYRLDAVRSWEEWVGDCSLGPWIQVVGSPSGRRGFPVAGEGDVHVLSRVEGPAWRSIPVSPVEWELDTATAVIHLGPGWSLLTVTGGGHLEGGWLDRWNAKSLSLLALLVVLVSWGISLRMGVCALCGGLAIGGSGAVWLGVFAGLAALVAIGVRLPENGRIAKFVHQVAMLPGAILAVWLVFHTLWEVNQAIQPQSAVVEENFREEMKTTVFHEGWYIQDESECGSRSAPLEVEAGAGDRVWTHEAPSAIEIGPAWRASPTARESKIAPTGPEVPFWDFTMGRIQWIPKASGKNPSVVDTRGRMRILAAPPWLTALSRLVGVAVLWGWWIGLCLHHPRFRRRWSQWTSLVPRVAVLLALCAPVAPHAAQSDSVQGEILRSFTFDGRWRLSTAIVQVYGDPREFRLPLMSGEEPVDSLRIHGGQVVVSRGRDRFAKAGPRLSILEELASSEGEDVDVSTENTVEQILSGGARHASSGQAVALRAPRPPPPDSVESESFRSGSWVRPTSWPKRPAAWDSRLPAGSTLQVSPSPHSRWLETWVVHCSPRFQPVFHGLRPGGEADAKLAYLFHPKPGDSLRVEMRTLDSVPVAPFQITHATLRYADASLSGARLWLNLRVSVSDTLRIRLPDDATEVAVLGDSVPREARRGSDGQWVVPISGSKGWTTVALTWKEPRRWGPFRRAAAVGVSAEGANLFVEVPKPEGQWVLGMGGGGHGPRVVWWLMPLLAGAVVWRLARSRRLPGGRLAWTVALGAWPGLLVSWDLVLLLFPYGDTMETAYAVNRIAQGAFDPLLNLYQVLVPMDLKWYLDRFDGSLPRPWMIVVPQVVCYLACLLWLGAIAWILEAAWKADRVS